MPRPLSIGVVTDEISRSLPEALEIAQAWGLSRFELREGGTHRVPALTQAEIQEVEDVLRSGGQVTALSPGVFKAPIGDEAAHRQALEDTLPRTFELAARFDCPLVIVFGFERDERETDADRARVLATFERAARLASDAGLQIAVENEPGFWIDRPSESAVMLDELDHPAVALNWDPANLHWGGQVPTRADLDVVLPHLANLHVKDYRSGHPEAPWAPVGEGETPWADLLPRVHEASSLDHVTLETHCVPLVESSRRSLDTLRQLLAKAAETAS